MALITESVQETNEIRIISKILNLEDLIESALQQSIKNRNRANMSSFSNAVFKAQFCTVAINIGRQTGKTTYIANKATSNDVIITENEFSRNFLHERTVSHVWTMKNYIEYMNYHLPSYSKVYVDDASDIMRDHSNNFFDNIYRLASADISQSFIFLG